MTISKKIEKYHQKLDTIKIHNIKYQRKKRNTQY